MKEIKEQISKLRADLDIVRGLAQACAGGSEDAAKKLAETHGVSDPSQMKAFLAGLGAAFDVLQSLDASAEKAAENVSLGAVAAREGEVAAKELKDELSRLRALADAGKSVAEYLMDDDDEWRDFEGHLAAGNPVEEHVLYQAHVASGDENPYFQKMVAKYAPEKKKPLMMGQ